MLTLFFVFVSSASAATIFSDDFDSGANSAWGNELGSWVTNGGVYDAQSISAYSSVTTFPSLTDFTVNVDINNLDDGGVMLRSSDWGNGVALITGGKGNGNFSGLYWHIKQNGSWGRILNEVYIPGLFGSDVSLQIVVSGNKYSAYVNGATSPATTLTTSVFSSGKVALYDNSRQTFDNFSISTSTPVPEPATMSLFGLGLVLLVLYRKRMANGIQ